MDIAGLIQRLADKNQEVFGVICEVVAVDEAKRSCEVVPVNGKANITEVRIQASYELQEGIFAKPKIGSFVVVNFIDNNNAYVALFDKIEELHIKLEESEILIDKDGITINGGALGGLVKIEKLLSQLNKIEIAYNDLLNAVKNHNHAHPRGPTTALLAPITIQDLQETELTEIENTKIKHG